MNTIWKTSLHGAWIVVVAQVLFKGIDGFENGFPDYVNPISAYVGFVIGAAFSGALIGAFVGVARNAWMRSRS